MRRGMKMEKRTTHIEKYYTSLESMKRRMENSYRSEGFFGPYSVDSHEKWRERRHLPSFPPFLA